MTTATISYAPTGATDSLASILLRASDRDPVAWNEIFHRYSKLVFATVRSFRLQEADALDAMQMTWLRLAVNAHRIQDPERLGGWLVTTARHECMRILRQAQSGLNHTDDPVDAILPPSPTNVQAWEERHEVLRLLDCLPPLQRQVIELTMDGYTPAEIASELGITSQTIRSRLIRARRTLRREIEALQAALTAPRTAQREQPTPQTPNVSPVVG